MSFAERTLTFSLQQQSWNIWYLLIILQFWIVSFFVYNSSRIYLIGCNFGKSIYLILSKLLVYMLIPFSNTYACGPITWCRWNNHSWLSVSTHIAIFLFTGLCSLLGYWSLSYSKTYCDFESPCININYLLPDISRNFAH